MAEYGIEVFDETGMRIFREEEKIFKYLGSRRFTTSGKFTIQTNAKGRVFAFYDGVGINAKISILINGSVISVEIDGRYLGNTDCIVHYGEY